MGRASNREKNSLPAFAYFAMIIDRTSDILQPAELAQRHNAYRYRVMMGPSYRADMWAALEKEPALSAAELAQRTYGSFATACQVKQISGSYRARRGVTVKDEDL